MTVGRPPRHAEDSDTPWGPGLDVPEDGQGGDPALAGLVRALRLVQDRVVGLDAPPEVVASVTGLLEDAAARMAPYRMSFDGPPSWEDLHRTRDTRALGPVLEVLESDHDSLLGSVTFTPFFLGGNGAAHGGSIPLFYDEVLGRLANSGRPICRTAYLNVDFRRVTPIGRPLRVEARFEREEGRKRYLYAAMYDGGQLITEARGLFVELRPGAA
jgi:acyl-coenzyme A thioesterase PaaI-like protein